MIIGIIGFILFHFIVKLEMENGTFFFSLALLEVLQYLQAKQEIKDE